MSRLSSFRGPSTPSASPVKHPPTSPSNSTSRLAESTYHRKVRSLLQELRATAQTWDDIVLVDGLKAARGLVDTRTDLENALALVPAGTLPRTRLVTPKLAIMEKRIEELDGVLVKLGGQQKQFRKMNAAVENMESLLCDAHKVKGWQWVYEEPLWTTWPLEKFVSTIPDLLIPYHRSLHMHIALVDTLRPHNVSFQDSREAIAKWVDQPCLEENGWDARWEELCAVEVERWDAPR
ncbi:hypothetical protein PLICRDRAFT_176275 [Plicaturopsis crispa FD-325 SS-3]|nr:hypothetical protein PLICRDRAFT_176275 [Plicaturopsis crispa FD-325 SS-3]